MESTNLTDMNVELDSETSDYLNIIGDNDTLSIPATTLPPHFKVVTTSVEFLPWGLLLLIICCVGIIGNILSALVLIRPRMRSTYSTMTLGLTFCDTVYFSTKFFRYGIQSMFLYFNVCKGYTDIFLPYIGPEIRAVNFIASTATTYMTIAVSIDRYMAVCWPYQARQYCNRRRAVWATLIVILFANVYNLPRWWEFSTEVNYTIENNDQSVTTYYKMSMTPLRNILPYKTYYTFWAYSFVMFYIPFGSLCFFNYRIWKAMRLTSAKREKLTTRQKDENSFAVMLLAVVVAFLVCSCIFPIIDIYEFAGNKYPKIYDHIGNVMLTVNSAVNFILYCVFGRRFREEFVILWYELTGRLRLPKTKGDISLSGVSKPSADTGDSSVSKTEAA